MQTLFRYLKRVFARYFCVCRCLDLGSPGLYQRHDMVEHIGVLHVMIGNAGQIDHMLARTASGDADIGLARFAWAIDYATNN